MKEIKLLLDYAIKEGQDIIDVEDLEALIEKYKCHKKKEKEKKPKRVLPPVFMRPLVPSKELAKAIGKKARPRTQVVKDLWTYIKRNDLQNPKNRRNIIADSNLKPVFGQKEITMFELPKILEKHLSEEKK